MNPILQVKLKFSNERNQSKPQGRNLSSKAETSVEKIENLIENLNAVLRFYRNSPKYVSNLLIDVNYNDIIAKSKRIKSILKPKTSSTNDIIVGARFSNAPEGEENHIITYYVDEVTVKRTINELQIAKSFLNDRLGGKATFLNFNSKNKSINYDGYSLGKTKLRDIIIDCSVVDSIGIPKVNNVPNSASFLVTFYKTELSVSELLEKLKIDEMLYRYSFYGSDTISITRELFDILEDRVPYMISMISSDLAKATLNDIVPKRELPTVHIPDPSKEPIVGVIDTFFDETVYFNKWVENHVYLDDIERTMARFDTCEHGTQVS